MSSPYLRIEATLSLFCPKPLLGKVEIIQLTENNYESFLEDNPLESLQKTFLDAIAIAVRLGYSYIWIDSLCIMQDSSCDKEAEVARMGSIFRNSVCTIAALWAYNNLDGCLASRNPRAYHSCVGKASS
jgi:heterokaryon incompatibility protein (HET)